MEQRRALLELSKDELEGLLTAWGQPRYRADQVWRWLYKSLVSELDEMRNLPAELRAQLGGQFVVSAATPLRRQRSHDGLTEKVLLRLADGEAVEAVLMAYDGRRTVCVSSQVGCAVRCAFCATGLGGWTRNLSAGEIVEQVLYYARQLRANGQAVSNVVYMGMGEPFLNYEAVRRSIDVLNDPDGFDLGARRVTVSTAGLVPGIERLADEGLPVGLAISLHAPTDELRDRLVPLNRRYPLERLIAACREYTARTRRRVTFEYALIDGVNDGPGEADALARLLRGLLCHVNLIPVNPVAELPYRPSPHERVVAFERRLREQGVNATLRVSRGADIQAGCGQLRGAPAECETIVNT
jgi:23S rRNA (adenine2503-C2)-methyltransferase